MSQLVLKIPAFHFHTSVDLHESRTTFSCCNIISRQLDFQHWCRPLATTRCILEHT